jgi:hypothetical protein
MTHLPRAREDADLRIRHQLDQSFRAYGAHEMFDFDFGIVIRDPDRAEGVGKSRYNIEWSHDAIRRLRRISTGSLRLSVVEYAASTFDVRTAFDQE